MTVRLEPGQYKKPNNLYKNYYTLNCRYLLTFFYVKIRIEAGSRLIPVFHVWCNAYARLWLVRKGQELRHDMQ